MRFLWTVFLFLLWLPVAQAETRMTKLGAVTVETMAENLETPWSLAFLPDGRFLVTERSGKLLLLHPSGSREEIAGLPEIWSGGQGGLLDVLVPRNFASSGKIYLSYSKPQESGAGTAVGVGELDLTRRALIGFRQIFEMTPGSSGKRHFGSRLVEGPEGHLFVTLGERGDRPSAQDLSRNNGSILRVARDGTVPGTNPFVAQPAAQPEIWSYGHRNPQGLALDSEGALWAVEHGARGGDEVNRIRKGANYGWPVIAYGRHYSGARIGEGTEKQGMEQPDFYWDPSIAPSGLAICSGKLFPDWRGDFLVGSLKFGLVSRLERNGDTLVEAERITWPETARTRDIREAPDGAIWIVSEGNGAVYRLTPAEG